MKLWREKEQEVDFCGRVKKRKHFRLGLFVYFVRSFQVVSPQKMVEGRASEIWDNRGVFGARTGKVHSVGRKEVKNRKWKIC